VILLLLSERFGSARLGQLLLLLLLQMPLWLLLLLRMRLRLLLLVLSGRFDDTDLGELLLSELVGGAFFG